MKKILSLLTLLVFCTAAHAIVYPTLEQVATKLYANYSVPETQTGEKIQYQKKRDGWHVARVKFNDSTSFYEIQMEELFWSATSGKYKTLTIFRGGMTSAFTQRIRNDVADASEYDYQRIPYYGYDGWDQDVITDFGGTTSTNDTLMEGLARAYSNFAQGYLSHQYSFHVRSQIKLPENERIELFISNEKKAIAIYDILRKRSAHYVVVVGEVTTKYFNEVMATYETLLYYKRESAVKEYFTEEFYDPVLRTMALSMLQSCGQNGILFTNGDNDSYPLWYFQWIKGVRTDVAVMNVSLLSLSKNINRYRDGFMKVKPVSMSMPADVYAREELFVQGEGSSIRNVQDKDFITAEITVDGKIINGNKYTTFSPCKIVMHRDAAMYKDYDLSGEEDSIVVSVNRTYLYQGEMAVLDIVLTNYKTRPVYIAVTLAQLPFLENNFFVEGMVRRFIPATERLNTSEMNWMGPVASVKIFQKNMLDLLAMDTAAVDLCNSEKLVYNFKLHALYAAEMLISTDKSAAKAMINTLYIRYPITRWPVRPMDAYGVQIYYKCGDQQGGDKLGAAILDEAGEVLGAMDKKTSRDDEDKRERARYESALNMLKATFNSNNRVALAARTEKLIEQFY